MLRESKLSECDSCLLVVLECVMGCLQNNQNDQEMDVRKLRFRHPLPGLGCVLRTQKTARKWMHISCASGIRFLASGVFAEHRNGLDIPAEKQAFRGCIQASGVFGGIRINYLVTEMRWVSPEVRDLTMYTPLSFTRLFTLLRTSKLLEASTRPTNEPFNP